jgi:hypothetical protein
MKRCDLIRVIRVYEAVKLVLEMLALAVHLFYAHRFTQTRICTCIYIEASVYPEGRHLL